MWRHEPPSRVLARHLVAAGLGPSLIHRWLQEPRAELSGLSPVDAMRRAAADGRIDLGWRRLHELAEADRVRPCGLLDPLDEDGICPCGERHVP